MSDPKAVGIIANGYPHQTLKQLGLENKHQAFYATKMALWCYLIPSWSIDKLGINPSLTGLERERGELLLAAAKKIYLGGTQWTSIPQPTITTAADKPTAYEVTVDGQKYLQQVFAVHSETWVGDLRIDIGFAIPDNAAAVGARLVNMDNQDITQVEITRTSGGPVGSFDGQYKILVPADNVDKLTGTLDVNLAATVYKYEMVYAICAETDKYGQLQNYLLDTDPVTDMAVKGVFTPPSPTPPPGETPETGLQIIKLEEGTKTPLAGAIFQVVAPDGSTMGSYSTGNDGTIILPILEIGHYTITEISPPRYHLLPANPTQHANAEYGKVSTVTFYNAPYGDLRVEKVDGDTGEKLNGAVVQIKHIESGATYSATTATGGSANFTDLKPGAYEIQELTPPNGWQKDPQTHTTTVVAGESVTFTLKNSALPGLTIIKYDTQSHETMPGVTFEIFRDGTSQGHFETDALGEIRLVNQQPGTYRIVELDTGDSGHIADSTPQEVELTAGGGIKELYFFNDLKPGMWLVKVDAADPSKVIPNAVFTIRSVAGDFGPKEFTTGADGTIDLSELPTGAYEVVETSCPGYVVDSAQRIIQLEANQTARFVFTNSKEPSLHLVKLSADGGYLPGVTFRIAKIEDGAHYLDRVTDQNGEINIDGLKPGVYSVVETATAEGYILDKSEYHVELFPGKTSTLVLNNDKKPDMVIHKNDAVGGGPVEGATYVVKHADGSTVTTVKTDHNGEVRVEALDPGPYQIIEQWVPDGFLLDTTPQLITLVPNRTGHVYFQNNPKPSIDLTKVDAEGQFIPGAVFTFSEKSGTVVGDYTVGADGHIKVFGLKPGFYVIVEKSVPAPFILDPTPHEVELVAGKTTAITVENHRRPTLTIEKRDSVVGDLIPGARFQVWAAVNGSLDGDLRDLGTFITDETGRIVLDTKEIDVGWVRITELEPAPGYSIKEPATQDIFLHADTDEVATFYNIPLSALVIVKEDEATGEKLAGARFRVRYLGGTSGTGGTVIGEYDTSANGTIVITALAAGTYIIEEIKAAPGHTLDSTPQTVYLSGKEQDVVTVVFGNKSLGSLLVKKVDSVTNLPIPGVVFKVTDSSGAVLGGGNGEFTTDASGAFTVPGLKPGTSVVVTELRTVPGYVLDQQPQTVQIESGKTHTLTFRNIPDSVLVIKKVDSETNLPLAGVTFLVTDSDGTTIGPNNGEYVTGSDGTITITGLKMGDSIVAKELRTIPGYVLDETPQTVKIEGGKTHTLTFRNTPDSVLILKKLDSVTNRPVPNVTFYVTDSSGAVLGGSNGEYTTGPDGTVVIPGIAPGTTVVVKELRPAPNYVLDETPQTVKIVRGQDHTLIFYNEPVGGLRLIKTDGDTGRPIKGVQFEITHMNGEVIGVYKTDSSGQIRLSLEAGWYEATEKQQASGYLIDPERHKFEVKDGETYLLELTNRKASQVLIHKVDAMTGEGIYGVTFLLYDSGRNPIGQYVTDQGGYIYLSTADGLTAGKYFMKELEAEGYQVDEELKTVYLKAGETTEITWKNTAVLGQIQVMKYAADANTVTNTAAGVPLPGAVFEITRAKSGVVVGYITSDARGVAASSPLPLGRYFVKEVTPPAYFQLDPQTYEAELEFPGQIIKLSAYDKSASLKVAITKVGNREILAGDQLRYDITVANQSNVPLSNFFWHDRLPTDAARGGIVTTGTYNQRLNYQIAYKTNLSDYKVLASGLLTSNNYSYDLAALPLMAGEAVTDIRYEFGQVNAGFTSVIKPTVTVAVLPNLANGYQVVNRADAGGQYFDQWETANTAWVTIVVRLNTPTLPKTGF